MGYEDARLIVTDDGCNYIYSFKMVSKRMVVQATTEYVPKYLNQPSIGPRLGFARISGGGQVCSEGCARKCGWGCPYYTKNCGIGVVARKRQGNGMQDLLRRLHY